MFFLDCQILLQLQESKIELQMSFYSSCNLFGYKIFKITSLPSAFTVKVANTSVECNQNYTTINLKNDQ
jgi:hypothetical protein